MENIENKMHTLDKNIWDGRLHPYAQLQVMWYRLRKYYNNQSKNIKEKMKRKLND